MLHSTTSALEGVAIVATPPNKGKYGVSEYLRSTCADSSCAAAASSSSYASNPFASLSICSSTQVRSSRAKNCAAFCGPPTRMSTSTTALIRLS